MSTGAALPQPQRRLEMACNLTTAEHLNPEDVGGTDEHVRSLTWGYMLGLTDARMRWSAMGAELSH